mgnify:CR=1 FL=1
MKKALFIIIPILFTAQSCNFLFGDLSGQEGSGPRGIYLSVDGGQSFEAIGQVGKDKNLSAAQVLNIFIEPGSSQNLLAATFNAGVYASENQGQNWVLLLPNFGAYAAFINPGNNQEIYAAGNRNKFPTILKSPDRGGTWVDIYSQPTAQGSVTALVSDRRNTAILYAGLTSGTVIKSLDGGQTWNALTDFDDRVQELGFSSDGRTLFALGRSSGLKKSEDAGKTWTDLVFPEKPGSYNDLAVDYQSSGTLYLATDEGLLVSFDLGANWSKLSLPATPEVNVPSAVAVNPKNNRQIFAAVRSTIYRSDDRGTTWRTESLRTNRVVSRIAIDPTEPNRIYVGLK